MLFLATWASVAVVPMGALLAMVLGGSAAEWPALLAALVIAIAAGVIAALWVIDYARLRQAFLRVAIEPARAADLLALPVTGRLPRLRHMAQLAQEVARLSRTLAERAELVDRLLRTDQMIVESLPDPLIVLAADRSVRRANLAARHAFGTELQAVLRQPGLRAAIDRAYAQGVTQKAALSLPVPVAREVVATVIPLDPPLADGGRAIILLSDRTRERAVERMRADFVANASHELRTPLASLIGFVETLRGPARDDQPAQIRFLGIMAEQAERMNRLIDDLLSLSRVELTEHQAPAETIDLPGLICRMIAELEPRLAERRVTLKKSIGDNLPAILGDTDQLAQVLSNLLDNALKYGKENGVIRLSADRPASGGRWPSRPGLLLSVTDDGPGIAKHHLPRLTERFYRVDKGRSRAVGGTGLGLAIVKHIVNRHRGQLVIDSNEGQGATFQIWLPAATSTPLPLPRNTASPHLEPGAP